MELLLLSKILADRLLVCCLAMIDCALVLFRTFCKLASVRAQRDRMWGVHNLRFGVLYVLTVQSLLTHFAHNIAAEEKELQL